MFLLETDDGRLIPKRLLLLVINCVIHELNHVILWQTSIEYAPMISFFLILLIPSHKTETDLINTTVKGSRWMISKG